MTFSFATSEAAREIIALMEAEAAPGDLSLLYMRRDDPLASMLSESSQSVIGIMRDDEGAVAAMVAIIPMMMYIGGELKNVCYITSMKKSPSYTKNVNWIRVFSAMDATGDYDAYFCSFVEENDPVQQMFIKRRSHIPYSIPLCKYETFIYAPYVRVKDPCPELTLVRCSEKDAGDALQFISERQKHKDLAAGEINGLLPEDLYCLKKDGRIVAAAALWDRREVKQYYLKECKGKMRFLRALNPLFSMLGYVKIPPDDTLLKFAFISFLEAEDDSPELMTSLFCRLKEEARKSFDIIVIGASHNSPKYSFCKKIRHISFTTVINEIVMNGVNDKPSAGINGENIDLECALL